jgi:hypothetical protein
MSRWRTLCVVACTVITGSASLTTAGPTARAATCGTRHGNWRTTTAPAGLATFQHVGADMGAGSLAVDPLDANRLYASPDKTRIVRSLDGGCSWKSVFDLAALPNQPTDSFYTPTASQYRIFQIVVPHGRAASDGKTVYALADMKPPDSSLTTGMFQGWPILVAVSTDGGSTWRVPNPPRTTAMPFGAPGCSSYFPQAWLALAPGHSGTVYFFCPASGHDDFSVAPPVTGGYNALYRSTDGGATWSVRSVAKVQLDGNGGLGSLLDVGAHDPGTLYATQPGSDATTRTTLTQFFVSHDGGVSFQRQFGGKGWDPDNVGFTSLTAASGAARLASFGQAGLCVSQDAGQHGVCWKPPLRSGAPGLVSGAIWSANGDKLFVTVAYGEDWQFTGCGEQRAGVLTLKHLRWHDLGPLPATAPGSNGAAITNLVADGRGNRPVMIAQPCVLNQGSTRWASSSAPAVLLDYAAPW